MGNRTAFVGTALLVIVIAIIASPKLYTWLGISPPRFFSHLFLRTVSYPAHVVNVTRALVPLLEKDAASYADQWLEAHNLTTQILSQSSARVNLLCLAHGAHVSDARVLLFTHLDVVPGGPPIELSGTNGRLVGRGTTDARGIAAAMMVAMSRLQDKRVALLLVTGEETDHSGIILASKQLEFDPSITLLNGEPTESKLATAQKGALKLQVQAKGVACHSAYPELGSSAILLLLDFLAELRRVEWPCIDKRCTTMNIGKIQGGKAANIVAGDAKADILFRLVTEPQIVVDLVEGAAKLFTGIHVGVVKKSPPVTFFVPPKAASRWGTQYVSYNTDVPYFSKPYRRAVLFGASSIHVAHTDDEYIKIHDLDSMPDAYVEITKELLDLDG